MRDYAIVYEADGVKQVWIGELPEKMFDSYIHDGSNVAGGVEDIVEEVREFLNH